MWRPDIIDLSQFYSAPLGHLVRRHVRQSLAQLWPDVRGQKVLGVGYATPFLRPFLDQADRVLAAMPANQGIQHWPREGPNRVFLGDELELPLPDQSMDRIVVVHALETTEAARPMLREIWRVMDSGGRALFIVPNRRGLWSRAEHTPFGHGHPYTTGQLSRLLRANMFLPEQTDMALHFPPFGWRPLLRANRLFERAGTRIWPGFAGLVMVEVSKQVFAVTPLKERRRRRIRSAPALAPATRTSVCGPHDLRKETP